MTRKRTRPRDRITQASCLLITALLIVSAVSAGVGTGMASAEPAGMVSVPDQNITEDIPADALVPLGASQLHDGRVLTDSHAMSLDVILTTPARAGEITGTDTASLTGDMALILRDTEHSAGRRVAIDSGLLQTALGYEPQAIYGSHENGEQWTAPAQYVDGYLVFDVPHFSSNTVTFSAEVVIDANNVSSNTQFSYTLSSETTPTNPTLSITGVPKTKDKYHSWTTTGVKSIAVSGDSIENSVFEASAPSKSITKTGQTGEAHPETGDIDGDGTDEIVYTKPSDKLYYYDPDTQTATDTGKASGVPPKTGDIDNDGTDEILSIDDSDNIYYYDVGTGSKTDIGHDSYGGVAVGDIDGDGASEIPYYDKAYNFDYYDVIDSQNTYTGTSGGGALSTADIDDDGTAEVVYSDGGNSLAYYDQQDNAHTKPGSGANFVTTGDVDGDGISEIVYLDNGDDIDYYDVQDGTDTTTGHTSNSNAISTGDIDGDGTVEIAYSGSNNVNFYDVQDGTNTDTGEGVSFSVATGDVDNDGISEIVYVNPNEKINYYAMGMPIQVDVDVGNDNNIEQTLNIPKGETRSAQLASLSPTTNSVSINSNGSINFASLSYTEITDTSNPEITINSNGGAQTQTIGYNGHISDGQQIDLSNEVNMSKIGGKTDINISLNTGRLNLTYRHKAQRKVSTIYDASTFEEKYNVAYTYGNVIKNAKVTIPFASERVVGIKRFEYRINGGTWQSVAPADRRFSNATATAYLSRANGGALPAGETVEVRATGRKVNVENGEVAITDPTKPGEPLDTQLKIESRSAGFSVNVGPTDDGDRIHYAYSSNYPTQDYVVIDGAGNQRLYLPESQPGDTFRMKHVRTKANVVAGDAKIRVVDPDDKKFEIMPGPGGDGDTIELTYYGTKPGNTYLLESLTREIILDTETANSPVTFVDDDSHEMWRILLESGGSGDTGGGGGLIGVASGAASNAGSAVSGLLPAISVPALGGIGGVGSAGFALALAGAVAVLVYGNVFGRIAGVIASLNPFGGTPASGGGADTGNGGIDTSGVTSALSGVVTRAGRVGGTAGVRVLRATTQLLTTSTRIIGRESARLARYLAANPSVALGLGGVGVAVAAYQGLVQLTPQATTAILIGSGGLITYLVLQRTGTFSWLSFGLIFGAFVILGAGAINPDVLASFGASLQDILPLLVIVGAYVVYRILQTRSQDASTPDTIVRFTGGGNGSDDNNN